jgi:hypothetical protein
MLTMLTTRTAALSVLVALTLPACDSKSEPGDDAGDEKGAAEEESVEEGESVEEDEEPAPVADFGREGELCDGAVLSAACQIDGVAGVEFCAWDDWSYTEQWTACLTETCSEPYKERPCKAGGVAYCGVHAVDEDAEAMYWGICGEANECEPGDSQLCPGFEEEQGITQGCTVDPYGRHIWNIEDCNTPLVLSFDGAVEFSAAAATAADFAVAGGTCMRADWPTARSPWLALDRDRSGSIDGGHELFGSATRLSAGAAPSLRGRDRHGVAGDRELDVAHRRLVLLGDLAVEVDERAVLDVAAAVRGALQAVHDVGRVEVEGVARHPHVAVLLEVVVDAAGGAAGQLADEVGGALEAPTRRSCTGTRRWSTGGRWSDCRCSSSAARSASSRSRRS